MSAPLPKAIAVLASVLITVAVALALTQTKPRVSHDPGMLSSRTINLEEFLREFTNKHSGLEKLEILTENLLTLRLTQAQETQLMKQAVSVIIGQADELRRLSELKRATTMLGQAVVLLDRLHHNDAQRIMVLRCAALGLSLEASLPTNERNQQLSSGLRPLMVSAHQVPKDELTLLFEVAYWFYHRGDYELAKVVYERATPTLLASNPSPDEADRYVHYALAIASNGLKLGEKKSMFRVLPAAERFLEKAQNVDTFYQMAHWEMNASSPKKAQAFLHRMLTMLPATDENLAWRGRAVLAQAYLEQQKIIEGEREQDALILAIRKSDLRTKLSQEAAVFALDRILIAKWCTGKGADIVGLVSLYPKTTSPDQQLHRETLLAYGYTAQGRCDEALHTVLHAIKKTDSLKRPSFGAAETYVCAGAVFTGCGDKQAGLAWWQKARAVVEPVNLADIEGAIQSARWALENAR